MKRTWLFILLFCSSTAFASFYARILDGSGYTWRQFDLKQLSCDVECFGLFYQTTITFEIVLTPWPYGGDFRPGAYEVFWDFNLVEGSVITDCWIKSWGAAAFRNAEIVDLTSAEKLYQAAPTAQPRLLLRQRWYRSWDGEMQKRFEMNFSPVTLTQSPTIKIRFLSPALPYYNARRIILPLNEFSTYQQSGTPTLQVWDHDNPAVPPVTLSGNASDWRKSGDYWRAFTPPNRTTIALAPESASRSYLRTWQQEGTSFYQLAVPPPVEQQLRRPRTIMLAIDLSSQQGSYHDLIQTFRNAVNLSTMAEDSVALIYSAFSPVLADDAFAPNHAGTLEALFRGPFNQSPPALNTLPQLLREAVTFFNQAERGGEIWLLTDASRHCDPLATAMEIIQQTHGRAVKPIVFRIISADLGYNTYQTINSQVYYGNDYLYENLARSSWGTFVRLRSAPWYDYLDLMLDAAAPTVNTVEIDPEPAGGLAYTRFPLNQGRANFPIALPYYEIGLYDGTTPFDVHFYGSFQGELFARTVTIDRQAEDPGWQAVALCWFDRYIQNLLLEPQSHETITYIEQTSVENRLLTPYSGFIVPGADGLLAFARLEEGTSSVVCRPEESAAETPRRCELSAFPNPFNAATTLDISLPELLESETVEVRIINFLGQTVHEHRFEASAGTRLQLVWDGLDPAGRPVGSGIYLVIVSAGSLMKNIKISLIK